MPRTLADIDRDIGRASSQMRGALADLARLDHERQDYLARADVRRRRIAFGARARARLAQRS